MQYEENLNQNNTRTASRVAPTIEPGALQHGAWLSRFGEYPHVISLALWCILLLCAPLMVVTEVLADSQTILALWLALLFITPLFAFSGLLKAYQFGLLILVTLFLVAPFFILNAMLHAHHMMTLGSAGLTQTEIPLEQMRVLWLSLVLGDTLSFISLSAAALIVFSHVNSESRSGFIRHSFEQLVRLLLNIRFWLFAIAQVIIFAMINSPSGSQKIIGMLLFGGSVLLLFFFHDRKASVPGAYSHHSKGSKRFSIVLAILSVPVLYVLLNGFVDYFVMMLTDKVAAHFVDWFEPNSSMPGFVAVSSAKFISLWLNLWPMYLLLCASLTMRGMPSK